jgi:hypothetical protein
MELLLIALLVLVAVGGVACVATRRGSGTTLERLVAEGTAG